MNIRLSTRAALIVFLILVVFVIAQATWWVVFMARLVDEKVEIAEELGASPEFLEQVHEQEISRQIMVGTEGVVILLVLLFGIWLIYRALVTTEQSQIHQRNFLMAVTHELKTPLASLKLYLDTLKSDRVPVEKKVEIVPRMMQDVDRLERLMDNVLTAARFERRELLHRREQIDLSRLVNETADRFERFPAEIPVKMNRKVEPGVSIRADEVSIGRAIDAILDNAFKYHNGSAIEIDLSLATRERKAILTIADHGIGIARRELDQVFDRFYRVGNELTRSTSGTGLGLYIAREVIRAHGGDIAALSAGMGEGTTITVTLPMDIK